MDLVRSFLAKRRGVRVAKDDRVRALVDVETLGMAYHSGPFSSGFACRIPRGSVMRVYSTTDLGFSCTPEGELEIQLVPASDRNNPKYSAAAFTFGLGDIGRTFEVLSD